MKTRKLEIDLKEGYSVEATVYDSEDIIARKAVLILFKKLATLEKVNSRSIRDFITRIPGVTFKMSRDSNDQDCGIHFRESVEI